VKKILIISIAVVFAFTGVVMATPPTNSPVEGFKITTETFINCVGYVSEKSNFTWHWNNSASGAVVIQTA